MLEDVDFVFQLDVLKDGPIEQVLEPGLVVAIEVRVLQHGEADFTAYVPVLFQHDAVLTTAVPAPLMTVVPMKHRLLWSRALALAVEVSSADFSTTPASVSYFSTGIASPVNAD